MMAFEDCGDLAQLLEDGDNTLKVNAWSIAPDKTCQMSVQVYGQRPGTYTFTVDETTTSAGSGVGAQTEVNIDPLPVLTLTLVEFSPTEGDELTIPGPTIENLSDELTVSMDEHPVRITLPDGVTRTMAPVRNGCLGGQVLETAEGI